ncbi:hypothetical protein QVD17_17172 [Tagetes erecta]|uniref:Uncharacterized protein n=1 Tax=Tagetes erecta TaxID=13708 RepID=A0AAD8KRT5_TARER|nr:hypothetical protein QVD17_17172 [Tagetes erecta]
MNPDDYSPAETLITFDRPIPLLRQPTPAGEDNSLILTFKNPHSFASAYKSCESNIIHQCETGARIACSVTASRNCAPPWWKTLTGGNVSKQDLIDREKCEEREMAECVERSRISCRKLAEDKCWPAFRDARVVVTGCDRDENVKKCVVDLVSRVCVGEKSVGGVNLYRLDGSWSRVKSQIGFVVVRGSDLLDEQI